MKVGRTLLVYPVLGLSSVLSGAAVIVMVKAGDHDGRYWWKAVVRPWAKNLIRAGGVSELEYLGDREALDGFRGVIMSNHESHFDPPSLIRASNTPLRFMAKQSLSRFPVFGSAMSAMGMLFVDRSDKEKAWASIRAAAETLAEGKAVLVFPEGTRSRDGDLLPFKKGGFVLAIESGLPILPIGIAGTGKVLPPGWVIEGTSPAVLAVGEPIETAGKTDVEALMAETREAIEALREKARLRLNERA